MSKIICDVCGSAYSDTASQCPICGTARRDTTATTPSPEQTLDTDSGYTYVKGGRFSRSNVKKYNSGKELSRRSAERTAQEAAPSMPELPVQPRSTAAEKQEQPEQPEKQPVRRARPAQPQERNTAGSDDSARSTNLILLLIVLILLVAVIFVGVYIVRNFRQWMPSGTTPPASSTGDTVGGVRIPCMGIVAPELEHVQYEGTPVQLDFAFNPATTTDEVTYISSDPAIAQVDEKGMLTVLADGEVTITVTCGEQTVELVLQCTVTEPSVPDPSVPPTEPEGKLELTRDDATFDTYGEEFQLYNGSIDASKITFTSSDPEIVSVDATGKIKILGKGTVTITAQYGAQTVKCIVRCPKVEVPVASNYKLNYTDITIKVGERHTIQLLNTETGAPVSDLVWYLSMDGYVTIDTSKGTGARVTGTAVTGKGVYYVRVMCDYEGVTYTCIVRVKAAE